MDKTQLIKKEIEKEIEEGKVKCQQSKENNDRESFVAWSEHIATCGKILQFIDSLPEEHINFPHEINIVEKVFGAGNLESWEYREAEKLVLLAKEELLKDLEINKEPASEDLEEAVEKYAYNEFPSIRIPNTVIELAFKACAEWLDKNAWKYARDHQEVDTDKMIEDFKKAMEG